MKKYLYILLIIIAFFVIIILINTQTKQNKIENFKQNIPVLINTRASTINSKIFTQYIYYPVVRVVDGDTVRINVNGQEDSYRLIGINTPEMVDPRKTVECFGMEASEKAKELLSGKSVRIEDDPTQGTYDKYNRRLAYIYLEDGLFFNKYMIEQGYAYEYTYNTPYKYQTDFKNAENTARINQAGLWSTNTCNGDTTSNEAITSRWRQALNSF